MTGKLMSHTPFRIGNSSFLFGSDVIIVVEGCQRLSDGESLACRDSLSQSGLGSGRLGHGPSRVRRSQPSRRFRAPAQPGAPGPGCRACQLESRFASVLPDRHSLGLSFHIVTLFLSCGSCRSASEWYRSAWPNKTSGQKAGQAAHWQARRGQLCQIFAGVAIGHCRSVPELLRIYCSG